MAVERITEPPVICGLAWVLQPDRLTWRADVTPEFTVAWSWTDSQLGMRAVGVWRALNDDLIDRCFYYVIWQARRVEGPVDMAEIRARIAEAPARLAEQAAIDADLRALERGEAAAVQASLRDTLAAWPWAVAPKVATDAAGLLDRDPAGLGLSGMRRAIDLAGKVRAAVRKAAADVAREGAALVEADAAACADPDMRAAVHDGCRGLSVADEDRATRRNGVGWSPATSRPGHWLAGLDGLDARQAAIGLRLLRRHARQLPDDLLVRLGLAGSPAGVSA